MHHPLVAGLYDQLRLPLIAAPMYTVSTPELVIAQCLSGIVGSLPSQNARPQSALTSWLTQIDEACSHARARSPEARIAPYAVNIIVHQSNARAELDLAVCHEHKVPIIITSLRAPDAVVGTVHAWGGKVFHDVTTLRHAEKALEAGVDGLILVCAGAGGHGGAINPFALLGEVRQIFDGPIALSGAISRGQDIAAALAMGADFAYMGTAFIASEEARADPAYKQMVVESSAKDIFNTPYFSGISGNYLKSSIMRMGLDPEHLPAPKPESGPRAWVDIWGAGQGVGNIHAIEHVEAIVQRLSAHYHEATEKLVQAGRRFS